MRIEYDPVKIRAYIFLFRFSQLGKFKNCPEYAPVRAGIVKEPADFHYSSYGAKVFASYILDRNIFLAG